jgi:Fe-S cluster assembly iron-binding protein IscA
MALDEPKESDTKIQEKGFNFVIDSDLAEQYNHFSIVYQNGILFKGLRVFAHGAPHC